MKKFSFLSIILLYTSLLLISCYSDYDNDPPVSPEAKAPSITSGCDDVKVVSAKLKGIADIEAIKSDRMGVTKYGFIVSEQSNPTYQNGWRVRCYDDTKDGKYTVLVTNLIPNKRYYYCSYFYDGAQYQYGDVKSFQTNPFSESFLNCEVKIKDTNVTFYATINQKELGCLTQFNDKYRVPQAGVSSATGVTKDYTNSEKYSLVKEFNYCSEGVDYTYVFSIIYKDNYEREQELGSIERQFSLPSPYNADEVDLGLSVIWKGTNLGATSPEEVGNLYAWGELEVKDSYTENNYSYGKVPNIGVQVADNTYDISGTEYDVVKHVLGGDWVMPNYEQIQELVDNCSWEFERYKQQYGFKGTSKKNGKKIFIPSCNNNNAYFWGSDIRVSSYSAVPSMLDADYYLMRLSIGAYQMYSGICYKGKPVRGVRAKK